MVASNSDNIRVNIQQNEAERIPRPQRWSLHLKALMAKSALIQRRQYRTNLCQLLFPLTMILLLWLIQELVSDIVRKQVGNDGIVAAVNTPSRSPPIMLFYREDAEDCGSFQVPVNDADLGRVVVSSNGIDELVGNEQFASDGNATSVYGKIQLISNSFGGRSITAIGARKFYDRGGVDGAPASQCLAEPRSLTQLNLLAEDSTSDVHARLFSGWANPNDHILGGFEFTAFDAMIRRATFNLFINSTFTNLLDLPTFSSLISNAVFREFQSANGVALDEGVELNYAGKKDFPSLEQLITFDLISLIGPDIYLYIFFLLMPVFVGGIVSEKENQLREIMKMMGLKNSTYWLVTYLFNLGMYVIAVTFMILIAVVLGFRFFTVNSPLIYIIFFALWGNCLVALAFVLSTFFGQARTASVVGYLVVFGSGLIGTTLVRNFFESDSTSAFAMFIIQCWPPFAFYRGLLSLGDAVAFEGTGLSFSDLSDVDVVMETVWIYLLIEWIFLMPFAIYLEKVVPSRFGIQSHPLFCCRRRQEDDDDGDDEKRVVSKADYDIGQDVIAQETLAMSNSDALSTIKLRHLRKEFPKANNGRGITAVHDLSMIIEYGKCVTWLGSNGAGKSTSISMLCGYQQPTSGTALVFGKDIRNDIDYVHSIMGVCPQDNVLWPSLTGGEHLEFFGRLKGLDGDNLEQAVISGLRDVELHEWRHKNSMTFSGGMKRRLCVAISLIGDPKVVLLDEPTTGLDPASRSGLWNIINQRKKHCAMLLTTHSMEEAEYLCDSLGIFERGRLRVFDSTENLKHRYTKGYKIGVVFDILRRNEVHEFVLGFSERMILLNSIGGTSNFECATTHSNLGEFFAQLTQHQQRLGIIDWGISNTSLEEVFVQIATDGKGEMDNKSQKIEYVSSIE